MCVDYRGIGVDSGTRTELVPNEGTAAWRERDLHSVTSKLNIIPLS
jgi:hypothetical protein